MPPIIATLICILLILYLFWMDRKKIEGVSKAIWIPFIWMFFAGSREFSLWLELRSAGSITEGNAYDRAIYTLLLAAGVIVLMRRRLKWQEIFSQNAWVWLYFVFGVLSFFWSDYPFVSFKRWIKAFGNVVMVLIILTEERPYEAFGAIIRRFAFLLLPLSVLFIKYYPNLGKTYHFSSGMPMYTGVASGKTGLGQICLLSGIYFTWNLLFNRWEKIELDRKLHFSIYFIILLIIAWLLYMANTRTSLVCLLVAICLLLIGRQPVMALKPRRILTFCITCVVLYGIMDLAFDVERTIITMLGRRPDLTTRVPMWDDLLSMAKDPIFGFGFEGFWLGARRQIMIERWSIGMNAHNGYLEMYLNLGLIGLCFILGWTVSGLMKVWNQLVVEYPTALLRLSFIVVILLFNWTEATFYGASCMWMIFLLGIIDVPGHLQLNESAIAGRR